MESPSLGVVRGITHGLFRKAEPFGEALRSLGGNLLRVYWYWSQIEPEPGRFVFDVVDELLAGLDPEVQLWVTISASSPWGTRQATTFLPPSPAKDPAQYERFVRELVSHCRGRVRYWQCDNEPSNVGLTWAGTAEEYVAQLRVMARAVRAADPGSTIVLGGATFGLPISPPDSDDRKVFEVLLRDGREDFDVFDLHLYGPASRIGSDVEAVRAMMRAHGYEKPVVAGEYGAPTPDQFPEAMAALQEAMAAAFATGGEKKGMEALYAKMSTLPPQLQMFMAGCPLELEARRRRIHAREVVMRHARALAAGVRTLAAWKLAPEVAGYDDPYTIMELFYGKLVLFRFREGRLDERLPAADAVALAAERFRDVTTVREHAGAPGITVFEAQRPRGPLLVVWKEADAFAGDNEPPAAWSWPWSGEPPPAIDALGARPSPSVREGRLTLPVSVTPIFLGA